MTDEIQERARQFLADQILRSGIQIHEGVMDRVRARKTFNLPDAPARVIEESASMMAIHLAKMIASGEIPLQAMGLPDRITLPETRPE